MKKLSLPLLADTVAERRREKKITQKQLSELTGINRSLLSRLESRDFTPSVEQLQALGEALDFEVTDLFTDSGAPELRSPWRGWGMWARPWRCCWPGAMR